MAGPVLTHVALHCRDFAKSVAFYREFCGLAPVHERRDAATGAAVAWLAEPGREKELIFVLVSGGPERTRAERDYGHFGFALESRAAVDAMAERARRAGCLLWPAREEAFPVGYFCGVADPDGNAVEFSYGQPLGAGGRRLTPPPRSGEEKRPSRRRCSWRESARRWIWFRRGRGSLRRAAQW